MDKSYGGDDMQYVFTLKNTFLVPMNSYCKHFPVHSDG